METNYQKETKRSQQSLCYFIQQSLKWQKQKIKLNNQMKILRHLMEWNILRVNNRRNKKKRLLKKQKVCLQFQLKDHRGQDSLIFMITIDKMLIYSDLCHFFKEIDEMLLFLQSQQKQPFLNIIYELLSQNSKIKVTQQIIQQILEIFANAYDLNWTLNEKLIQLDRSDLIIISYLIGRISPLLQTTNV
ncbi:unnamed protein product [Paramecium sonneborni]|uniref:Uncharacterized protein n=1 Tax=Paramecium sonneborni TaxID=65129 RepID=A0A8S1RTR1_9CILI|nr:unnamed protein product [Paramecium sonneborni]